MSESNYMLFYKKFIGNINKKQIYLWINLSRLNLSKILIYRFLHDYVNAKFSEKAKLCYIDRNRFIVYIKTDEIYKDIAEVV